MKFFKSSFYVLCAVIIAAIFVGCGDSEDSSDSTPTAIEDYYVYLDNWNADIDTENLYFQAGDTAPHLFAIADVDDGKVDTTGKSLEVDFSGLTTDGWNGVNAVFKAAKDLSAYNALTFWVKAEVADTEIEKILVLNGAVDGQNLLLKHSGLATLDMTKTNVFGTDWRKVTIPIFNSAYLKSSNNAVQILHAHAIGALGKFTIDEIRYTKLATLPTVNSIAYSNAGISVTTAEGVTAALPGTITIALNDMGTGDVIIEDTTKAQVTWTSADETIATVDSTSFTITGKAAGTTTVKAKLIGTTIEGPEISVTVTETATAPEKYFFYTDTTTAHATDASGGTALFTHYGGYESTMTATETATGGANSTDKYLSLQGTNTGTWAAGGWGATADVDLSAYNTLVFWAKSATATAISFVIEDGDNNDVSVSTTINTTWTMYSISFNDLAVTSSTTIRTLKYELPATGAQVDIDEIYLENKALDATPTSVTYPTDFEVWVPVGGTTPTQFPGEATIETVGAGTITDKLFTKLFVSSAAMSKVTPSTTSVSVTGAAVGTDTLTLSLIEAPTISGPTIDAHVFAADTSDNYYFYGATLDYAGVFYPGYGGTITSTHEVDAGDNNNEYLKLVDANTEGWAAAGFQIPDFLDISATQYTHLVVKARAVDNGSSVISGSANLNILLKFGADGAAGASIGISAYDSAGTTTPTALTLAWQTYKIPITALQGAQPDASLSELSYINLEFPFDDAKTTAYQVEIDELYFWKSPASAPDAITDLAATATAGSDTSISLAWSAPSSAGLEDDGTTAATIVSYTVFYQEGATIDIQAAPSLQPPITSPPNSATVVNLKAGTQYTFAVVALNSAGLASISNMPQGSTTGTYATPDRYYIFTDATAATQHIDSEVNWDRYPGYDGSIEAQESTGTGADSTSNFLHLTGTAAQSWASGGWGERPGISHTIDFSGYEALVFWAKQPDSAASGKTAASSIKFGIVDSSNASLEVTSPDTGAFGTTWTKYEILLSAFTGVDTSIVETIKYTLNSNNDEILIDEIYLRKTGAN